MAGLIQLNIQEVKYHDVIYSNVLNITIYTQLKESLKPQRLRYIKRMKMALELDTNSVQFQN